MGCFYHCRVGSLFLILFPHFLFKFSDADDILCLSMTGRWIFGQTVMCVPIFCGPAPNISHATLVESGRNVTSQAIYTCDEGYVLKSAASSRTCNKDGNWSQEDVVCEPARCAPPVAPTNGEIHRDRRHRDLYDHGDTVTYSCQGGNTMLPATSHGKRSTTSVMTCEDGNWTLADPNARCISCDDPPDVAHATWELPSSETAVRVFYSCESGYNFSAGGGNSLTCSETTGVWLQGDVVRCEPIDCGEPPSTGNVTFTIISGTKYNDSVTYSCKSGYVKVDGGFERQSFIIISINLLIIIIIYLEFCRHDRNSEFRSSFGETRFHDHLRDHSKPFEVERNSSIAMHRARRYPVQCTKSLICLSI